MQAAKFQTRKTGRKLKERGELRSIIDESGRMIHSASSKWKGGRIMMGRKYVGIKVPGHPRSSRGYVMERILVAEKALGRYLEQCHPVHHVNEIKTDNRNCNLVICEDQHYHALLHARARTLRAGGNPDTQKCCGCCKTPKDITTQFYRNRREADGLSSSCISCAKSFYLRNYVRKRILGPPRPKRPTIHRINGLKTHCKLGHPFDETNTRVDTRGYRVCRNCERRNYRLASAKRKHQKQITGGSI